MDQFLLFCLCALFKTSLSVSGELVSGFLGDSVKLSVSEDCDTENRLALIRLLDNQPTVAERVRGAWEPGESYRDRIESGSASSVQLNRLNYNDGGYYEFTCGGALMKTVQLQAVILSNNNRSVSEGDTLSLPCYCQTVGRSVESVRWERDGDTVLELDVSSREVRYGAGFKGRAALSSGWSSLGDLSLTVTRAAPQDRGDYHCSVDRGGRRERGTPAAVRVTIRKSGSTSPPQRVTPEVREEEAPETSWSTAAIPAAVVFVVAAVLFFLLGWCLKTRRSARESGPGAAGKGTDPPAESNGNAYRDEESDPDVSVGKPC